MEELKLAAQRRVGRGKSCSGRERRRGAIPGVVYGESGPLPLLFDGRELRAILRQVVGRAAVVTLDLEGKELRPAVVADFQRHPTRDSLLHVDFHEVSLKKKMYARVPVHPLGVDECIGVRQENGIFEVVTHAVEVRCLPRDLPSTCAVDVSGLRVGQKITVGDLPPLAGVEFVSHGELVLVSCTAPREEKESEAPATPAAAKEGSKTP
ncbi:MAG: 50S ribosomal protein L25 [Puniceicoccales bacterium]|jgi:large subunit ribosomal protein L25|nr:50S ribosomal protein L25 [Puniceicoccales bacterium]